MSRRRNMPPRRTCPVCGGDHYSYAEVTPCSRCRDGSLENAREVVSIIRARRQERLDALEGYRPPGWETEV